MRVTYCLAFTFCGLGAGGLGDCGAAGTPGREGIVEQSPGGVYIETAWQYADAMLDLGRDHYGERHSPAFVDTVELHTMSMPWSIFPATTRLYQQSLRSADSSTGCNPMDYIAFLLHPTRARWITFMRQSAMLTLSC